MKIYCSGIGGIGLSAYAALQKARGHDVTGSDRSDSALLDDLRSQGIAVVLDQTGKGIPSDTELFVSSEAIPADAPERKRASEMGIRSMSYPEAVGELSRGTRLIAVCGTHGKSSTTAMAARLLIEAGLNPTVIVGTKLKELGGRNWRNGGDLFLLEACEYRESFLHYDPSIVLLTTCDGDHFDFYGSQKDYEAAFVRFLKKLPADGSVITHGSDPQCADVSQVSGRPTIDADTQPLIPLQTPGEHMRRNAQLVLALGQLLGLPEADTKHIVSGYAGSWRRLEKKGVMKEGATVIDDYGHHPAEIRATLQAVREEFPEKNIVCVFQPHTHDRTKKLYKDFTKSFDAADVIIIPNIYVARSDIETGTVDVGSFVRDIAVASGKTAIDGKGFAQTERLIRSDYASKNDVVLCMGAGDITSLASALVR